MVLIRRDDVLGMLCIAGRPPGDLGPVGGVGHHPVAEDAVLAAGGGQDREEPAAAGVDVPAVVEGRELGVGDLCRAADYAELADEAAGQSRFDHHLRGITRGCVSVEVLSLLWAGTDRSARIRR